MIVVLCNALSVALLIGLHCNGSGPRMLVLATAFAWSAIGVLVLALTMPGVLRAEPLLGAGHGLSWIYAIGHVGPPLLVAFAVAPWSARWDDRRDRSSVESGRSWQRSPGSATSHSWRCTRTASPSPLRRAVARPDRIRVVPASILVEAWRLHQRVMVGAATSRPR